MELLRRGEDVLAVTLPEFSEEFSALGLPTVTAPPALAFSLQPEQDGGLWGALVGRSVRDWARGRENFDARMRWLLAFIRDHHSSGRTVVVARSGLAGARIARELFDIRLCTVHHSPASFRSRIDNHRFVIRAGAGIVRQALQDAIWRLADAYVGLMLRKRLNGFRASLGLPAVGRLFDRWAYSPDLNLGLFPSWYSRPQPDWPANARLAGFPAGLAQAEDDLPEAVRRFLSVGEPPVVITYGAHEDRGGKLERIVAGLSSRGGFRAIILGREAPAGPGSERLLYCRFAPLRALLPHCKALVHHGGIGTMAAAFSTGTPQIVIPVVGDQWDQARRAAGLGCAAMLYRRQLERRFASTVARVTSDPGIHAACRAVSARMALEDGIAGTADWLETLASRPRTLPGAGAQFARGNAAVAAIANGVSQWLLSPAFLLTAPLGLA
ncbi:MAG TPA: glycosyltransferase [Sphingomicrobium sp.]|nr:glycosyltransferase [Sphingomicrobium sp.]